MKITFDGAGFTREVAFASALPANVRRRVWTQIRVVSFNAERMIKIKMPVDTGRARNSWGHSGGLPALPDDSIWDENEAALRLTQGSRVGYIEQLNEGSSQQAPAGFIDAEEQRAVDDLSDALGDEVSAAFRG